MVSESEGSLLVTLFQCMRNNFLWITLAIMAFAFTWHVVSWSEQHGKLAMPPDYDDSHSLVEGAVRLLNFQKNGLGAAFDEYCLRNPHSFLHYYWTAALFAVFGIQEAVPYWANALFLFGVLWAFVSMLPRELPTVWKLVWAAAFLGVPVCFHVVFDFRSEVTMAALLFMGCACALEWAWGRTRSIVWFFATALCFALALAMKPVMFPYQLGMLGLCSMVYLASRYLGVGQDADVAGGTPALPLSKFWNGISWLIALWVLVLIPSIPHFWIYRTDIFGYILGVAFESDFYKLGEQQGAQWSFHWLGYSGIWHLGKLNLFFAGVLVLGLVLAVVPRFRRFSPGSRWVSLAFLTLGAFGGIAINSVHQPWFGMTFQLLLVASALVLLAALFQNEKFGMLIAGVFVAALGTWWLYDAHNRVYFAGLALGLLGVGWLWMAEIRVKWLKFLGLAILGMLLCYGLTLSGFIFQLTLVAWAGLFLGGLLRFSPKVLVAFVGSGMLAAVFWGKMERAPYHNYVARTKQEAGEEGLEWRRGGPGRVWQILKGDWKSQASPMIWCANYGWVDGNTISWEALKQGLAWKVYNLGTIFGSSKDVPSGLSLPVFADYLVVPSVGITGEIKTPYGITDWNSIVRARGSWELLGEVQAPKGAVTIYRNNTAIEQRDFSNATDWIKLSAGVR